MGALTSDTSGHPITCYCPLCQINETGAFGPNGDETERAKYFSRSRQSVESLLEQERQDNKVLAAQLAAANIEIETQRASIRQLAGKLAMADATLKKVNGSALKPNCRRLFGLHDHRQRGGN